MTLLTGFLSTFSPDAVTVTYWGLSMLGRKLPSRCDRIHLGMSEVPWAHGPEGEASGGPLSIAVWLLEGISIGFSLSGFTSRASAQGFTDSMRQGAQNLVRDTTVTPS